MSDRAPITFERSPDGIVTLTLDDPNQRVNTLNAAFNSALADAVDRLEEQQDSIVGVILESGKGTFLAGGDLNRLFAIDPEGRQGFLDDLQVRKSRMRRLERLTVPVVAILEGAALGGGLELALACHHRVAVTDDRVVVGLPEVTLGLLPGAGGVTRVTRMLGKELAGDLILSGRRLGVREAHDLGLIDELAADGATARKTATEWILANPEVSQPWDDESAMQSRPSEEPTHRPSASPARTLIARLISEGPHLAFDEALARESQGLADLVVSPGAKSAMRVTFFETAAIRSRRNDANSVGVVVPVLVAPDADSFELASRLRDVRVVSPGDPLIGSARARQELVLELVVGSILCFESETQALLQLDRSGDGGLVLEYQHVPAADHAVSALARSGAVPIALKPGGPSVSGLLDEAARRVMDSLAHEGTPRAQVDEAAAWLGLVPSSAHAPDATSHVTGLADRLIAALAHAAADLESRDVLIHQEDLNVAVVRAGGFPAWVGRPREWLAEHESNAAEEGTPG